MAAAEAAGGEPEPTAVLGIDETRRGRVRWRFGTEDKRWVRVDSWDTGFVDLAGDQGLLGQVEGRTSRCMVAWLEARTPAFREAIRYVAIDPAAPYAHAVTSLREDGTRLLPNATVVVDHFHLVKLANDALSKVRRRVTWQQQGRPGRKVDPAWVPAAVRTRTPIREGLRGDVERLDRRRPVGSDPHRVDREGGASRAAGPRPDRCAPRPAPSPSRRVLPLVRRCRHRRTAHPRGHRRNVVARHRGIPQHRHHERQSRGRQPARQAGKNARPAASEIQPTAIAGYGSTAPAPSGQRQRLQ